MRRNLRFKVKRTPSGYSAYVKGGSRFHYFKRFSFKRWGHIMKGI